MRVRLIPGTVAIAALALGACVVLLARAIGASVSGSAIIGGAWIGVLGLAAMLDYLMTRMNWRAAQPQLVRRTPPALALGVKRPVHLTISLGGTQEWRCRLYDYVDPTLLTEGMPVELTLQGGNQHDLSYTVTPTRRGEVQFAAADVRIRSQWRLWELIERLGGQQSCRVYPDFAQVARYAWLAGDRRLSEIGIKTYALRGEGTDFKQLSEYRTGDPIRHIDWRATLRFEKLIVREFQSERDQ